MKSQIEIARLADYTRDDYVIGMETPMPDALLQALCNEVKTRFAAATGRTGPIKVDLAFPEPPSSRFTVIATVTDKTTGEWWRYDIEIRAATVH